MLRDVVSWLFPRWVNPSCPQALRRVSTPTPLPTFDDVDRPAIEEILKILARYGLTGAFFLTGQQLESDRTLPALIYEAGHIVGNHAYHHHDLRHVKLKEACDEIRRTQELLEPFAPSRWFRPPYGAISKPLCRWLEDEGFTLVLWNLDSGDWRSGATEEGVVAAASRAAPGDIVLFHSRPLTARCLPRIVEIWAERGLLAASLRPAERMVNP